MNTLLWQKSVKSLKKTYILHYLRMLKRLSTYVMIHTYEEGRRYRPTLIKRIKPPCLKIDLLQTFINSLTLLEISWHHSNNSLSFNLNQCPIWLYSLHRLRQTRLPFCSFPKHFFNLFPNTFTSGGTCIWPGVLQFSKIDVQTHVPPLDQPIGYTWNFLVCSFLC